MLKDINQLKTEIDSAVHTNGPRGKTTAEGLNSLLKSLAVELVTQQQEAVIASSHKADLEDNGRIPSSQLPVNVDDVLEAATVEALPEAGETGKIYVVQSTNTMYRWSGTGYVALTSGGGVQSVGGQTGVVTLDQLGLDKVNNTSDIDKPLSTATLAALTGKAEINDARLTGLDAFVNCQAVRISTNAARTRTFYGGFATDENPAAIDGVVQALRDATEGETVQITTPLVFPFGDPRAAVLLVPPNITLDLNGFSLTSTNHQDGIGFTANGSYKVYGGNATIYSKGSGSCGLIWPDTVTPSIQAYELHLENTGSANCALVRSGSLYHRGSVTVKSPVELKANGVYLASNAAQYELVGDMTVYNSSTGFQVAAGCSALMRQGNFMLMSATAGVAILYDGGKLELRQCVVDLTAGPTTSGVRMRATTSTLILTDVTVLSGSIVDATSTLGQVTLRGSTVLPAAYGAAYLRAKGLTVTDERPMAFAN